MKGDLGPIYNKTALAHEELATRAHGLSPRLRQLLILIDGQRTEAQLVRLIPRDEFDEYLPVLEQGGFIVLADEQFAASTTMNPPATTIIPAEVATSPARAAPEALAASAPEQAPDNPLPATAPAESPSDENQEMRQRLVAALRDVIGAQGDELAERIERCGTRRELRELMPAALSIVEIIGGRQALKKFQEQAGMRSA